MSDDRKYLDKLKQMSANEGPSPIVKEEVEKRIELLEAQNTAETSGQPAKKRSKKQGQKKQDQSALEYLALVAELLEKDEDPALMANLGKKPAGGAPTSSSAASDKKKLLEESN